MAALDSPRADAALDRLPHLLAGGLEIVAARALGDRDDARDAVQETLARAIEAVRLNRIPQDAQLEAFVYGIARHVIADVQRRRFRERGPIGDPHDVTARVPSPLDTLVRDEERALLARALTSLPATDRELLVRCFVAGERVADIAAELGEPAERVRKRKSRALERLRAGLLGGRSHTSPPTPTLAT